MPKLLNIDQNSKTVKGQKQGYLTAVMYLAPATSSGFNMCPMAELAGCIKACLFTSGRAAIAKNCATFKTPVGMLPDNNIIRARITRTLLFVNDRPAFMEQLVSELIAFIKKAKRKNLTPVARPNGTSDIRWENIPCIRDGVEYENLMAAFPELQFYDYTKICNRKNIPANYHISLSYSEANNKYTDMVTGAHKRTGQNLVVVFRTKNLPETFNGIPVINGDESDLRFLDRSNVIVGLKAKGRARSDTSGFVIDVI